MKNKILKFYNSWGFLFKKDIALSLGENCLTDNILSRHGKKSLSTPYSHSRSNLEYAIKLERENYKYLLQKENIRKFNLKDQIVLRNSSNFRSSDIFSELHKNGFEFTHHDVLYNQEHRKSYERKIKRIKIIRIFKNVNFYYHYRQNDNMSTDKIFSLAEEFLSFYGKKTQLNIFTQEIIKKPSDRQVVKIEHSSNIRLFVFKTLKVWGGTDYDTFWAVSDDDLIRQMLN